MTNPTDSGDGIDPVRKRNIDDLRRDIEVTRLDLTLDEQQMRLDQLAHEDPVGVVWFGDNDDWIDAHLPELPGDDG